MLSIMKEEMNTEEEKSITCREKNNWYVERGLGW